MWSTTAQVLCMQSHLYNCTRSHTGFLWWDWSSFISSPAFSIRMNSKLMCLMLSTISSNSDCFFLLWFLAFPYVSCKPTVRLQMKFRWSRRIQSMFRLPCTQVRSWRQLCFDNTQEPASQSRPIISVARWIRPATAHLMEKCRAEIQLMDGIMKRSCLKFYSVSIVLEKKINEAR